jgi:rod shape-determining protein MreD
VIEDLHAIRSLRGPLRATWVPILSTIGGSAIILLPIVATTPVLPSFGLLMLLAWRLLRPEMWPASMALPLGLADDLLSGHYLGTSMALWTVTFLALDWVDHHVVWRDYWMEWVIAAVAIVAINAGSWFLNHNDGMTDTLASAIPATVCGILVYPAIVRLTAVFDRWRLQR